MRMDNHLSRRDAKGGMMWGLLLGVSLPAFCICGHLGARALSIIPAQALQSDLPAPQLRPPAHSDRSFREMITIISHRGLRAASRLSRSLPRYAACARILCRCKHSEVVG